MPITPRWVLCVTFQGLCCFGKISTESTWLTYGLTCPFYSVLGKGSHNSESAILDFPTLVLLCSHTGIILILVFELSMVKALYSLGLT